MENDTKTKVADYKYLKTWLSTGDIEELRSGRNEHGICLSRKQVYNIMKNTSRNYHFLNLLIKRAMENEALYSLQKTT